MAIIAHISILSIGINHIDLHLKELANIYSVNLNESKSHKN